MESNGEYTKCVVKAMSDNLSIIIEVQKKWDYVLNSKSEILKTKNRDLLLKIYDHLTDYLTQLESVQEVNPRLAHLKRNLTEEISKFHSYIRDVALKRKSLVMPCETPARTSLLSDANSDCLETSFPPKEITTDLHDNSEVGSQKNVNDLHDGNQKDVNEDSNVILTTECKNKKSLVKRLSKAFQIFVTCGSKI